MNILQSDIKLIPSCNERNLQPPDTEDRRGGEICKVATLLAKQTCKRSLTMFGKLFAKISQTGTFQYLILATTHQYWFSSVKTAVAAFYNLL